MIMQRVIISIIVFFFFFPLCVFAQKETVFVIESYHAEYPWDASYKKGLQETLGDKYNLVYFEMDTKRLPVSEYEKRAQMAWNEYKKINPELVILGDDNALKYLGPKFVNTTTNVVYLGINNNPQNYDMVRHKNITGVLERVLLKRSIVSIKQLVKIKRVLVLFDSGTTSQVVRDEVFSGKESVSIRDIRVDIKYLDNFTVWKKTVLSAKKQGYDVILVGLYHTIKDDVGKHVDAEKIVEWTSENTPIPPFAFWDFTVGPRKAIGGYVLFGEEQGKTAGKIALKILSGESPANIKPKIAQKGRFLFSKSQLKKWGMTLIGDFSSKVEYTK
jgi:ABC-type uncharacterized transport system substrate-binding protein